MKNHFTKSSLFVAFFLGMSAVCFAAARPICSERIYSEQEGRRSLYTCVQWQTDATGNVDVSVYFDAQTVWRGRGLADDVTSAKGFTLLLNGTQEVNISDYFTKNYTTGSAVYQLKLNAGRSVPEGSVIKFSPVDNICWQSLADDNGWGKKNFEYIYGTRCDAEPVQEAGSSVCDKRFKSDTYDGDPNKGKDSRMWLSVQTYNDGSIHFDIADSLQSVSTVFRRGEKSDALGGIGCFTYGDGQPLSNYFTLSGEDNVTACVLTPIVGQTLPKNTEITYKGTVQWKTAEHPNAYARNQEFKFLYGTSCYEPTGMENVNANANANVNRKVMKDGQLVIVCDGNMYNAQGFLLK